MKSMRLNLPLALAIAAALSAADVEAQGRGNGNGNGNRDRDRDRVEVRDRRDRDDDRDETRFERRNNTRRVPPGWCIGRGNPHNTPQNCRYNSSRGEWERYDSRDRRWENRTVYERGTNGTYDRDDRDGRNSGDYAAAHRDFHYSHDRQCRERAAQRPLDLRWQVQVRQECRAIHEEFHRRWGTVHR